MRSICQKNTLRSKSQRNPYFKFTDEQLAIPEEEPDYYKNYKLSDPQIYANVYQSDKYLQESL